ncbi:MAG: DUF2304 domain-containing protein [Candidatus Tenebribacter burtonii]|nr:DUF2304 domain-containing protein [Candidatus Tenebribacter burtonii]
MNNFFVSNRIQYIAVICSVALLVFIFELTRRKKIREQYSILWLFFSIIFVVLSIWREGLDFFARFLGIDYAPSALFLLLVLAIFLILIQFSVIISKLSEENKKLSQEMGLMKLEMEELKKIRNDQINKKQI